MSGDLDVNARYWPCYCEENVWHLCDALDSRDAVEAEALVIVVSNRAGHVAMYRQAAAHAPEAPVAWDYHVVLAMGRPGEWLIYDADTTLPQPCSADDYLSASFPDLPETSADYRPLFRWVDAASYRATLATDRRHMRTASGEWLRAAPTWPPIGRGHNLHRFIDMDDRFVGAVVDLAGLRGRLGLGTTD